MGFNPHFNHTPLVLNPINYLPKREVVSRWEVVGVGPFAGFPCGWTCEATTSQMFFQSSWSQGSYRQMLGACLRSFATGSRFCWKVPPGLRRAKMQGVREKNDLMEYPVMVSTWFVEDIAFLNLDAYRQCRRPKGIQGASRTSRPQPWARSAPKG